MEKKVLLFILIWLMYQVPVVLGQQSLETTTRQGIQTPEVASLGNHGDIPVNLYTGTPNISIPLYAAGSSVVTLPVSVNYNASGVRVDDRAGVVGLGWSLTAGGVVTRTMQSLPEDRYEKSVQDGTFQGVTLAKYQQMNSQAWQTFDQIASGNHECEGDVATWDLKCHVIRTSDPVYDITPYDLYDTEPDVFTYSAGELSGKFLIDDVITGSGSGYAIPVPHSNVKIKWFSGSNGGLTKFVITGSEGTSYTFDLIEYVQVTSSYRDKNSSVWNEDPVTYKYANSWFLTKITAPDTNEEIAVAYYSHPREDITPASGFFEQSNDGHLEYRLTKQQYLFDSFLIREIITNKEKVTFAYNPVDYLGGGIVLNEKTLDGITVTNKENIPTRKWKFSYEHFLSLNDQSSGSDLYHAPRQAKLVAVQELPADDSPAVEIPPYRFEYLNGSSNRLPYNYDLRDYLSVNWYEFYHNKGIDYWGFYTGRDQSTLYNNPRGRIPDLDALMSFNSSFNWLFSDMTPNAQTIQNGILTKITYPTGGYSELEYEMHDFSWVGDNHLIDLTLGIDYSDAPSSTIIKMTRTSSGQNPNILEFDITETVDAYFESRVARRFYSSNRPCNFESGAATSRLDRISGSQVDNITQLPVFIDPFDAPGSGPPCEGIASGSESMFYPTQSTGHERITLQPGTYRITAELTGVDDNANSIAADSVYVAEAWLRYTLHEGSEPPDLTNTYTFSEVAARLGSIEPRQTADLQTFENKAGGGLRVKQIRTFADENSEANVRSFIYKESDAGGAPSDRSSGVLVREPAYLNRMVVNPFDSGDPIIFQRVEGGNFMPLTTTQGANVGYREVTELIGENGGFGKIRNIYLSPVEVPDFFETIVESQIYTNNILAVTQDWARGKTLSTEYYNSSNSLVRKDDVAYGFEVLKDTQNLVPGVNLRTLQSQFTGNCESGFNLCQGTISLYAATVNVHSTGSIRPGQSTTRQFDAGGQSVSSETHHEYVEFDGLIKLPRRVTEVNSNGESGVTEYVYAHEMYGAPMKDKNMFSQPYSVAVKDGAGTVLEKNWTIWSSSDGFWRPRCEIKWDGSVDPDTYAPTTCP